MGLCGAYFHYMAYVSLARAFSKAPWPVQRGVHLRAPPLPVSVTCYGGQQWNLTRSWTRRCRCREWCGLACPGHSGTWLKDTDTGWVRVPPNALTPKLYSSETQDQFPYQGQNVPSCQHLQWSPRVAAAVGMRGSLSPLLLLPPAYGGGDSISAGDKQGGGLLT